MAPLLDNVPEPLLHGAAPMPHAAMQGAFDALYPKGQQWYWRADFVNTIPDAAVDIHQHFGSDLPDLPVDHAPVPDRRGRARCRPGRHRLGLSGRHLGIGLRRSRARIRPTRGAIRRWSIDYFEALHPYSAGGAYVNMMMDEGDDAGARQLPR